MTSAADARIPRQAALPADTDDSPEKVPVSRILALFRPYRLHIAALIGLVLLRAVAGVISPFLLRAILDHAIPERRTGLLSVLASGMILAALATAALAVWSNQLASIIGQHVMHDLRVGVYAHLQRMSLAFFTRTKTGDLLSRVVNDIGGVDNVLTNTVASTIQSATQTIAITVALFVMDWQFAAVGVVVVPLFLAATFGLGGKRRQIARRRQRGMSALTSLVEESLSVPGVLLSKTMGITGALTERFAGQSRDIADAELAASLAGRWRFATRGAALTIVPAVAYWFVGIELASGAAPTTLGTVVAFTSMLNRLISPASAMQGIGQAVSTSMALFGRIFAVLDLPADIRDREGAPDLVVTRGEVALHGVTFRYADDAAGESDAAAPPTLDGVDLVVAPGTMTAIVGATGSGKTSLAYLVTRLYEPQAGTITIDGTDIATVSLRSLAAAVGMVAQETYLIHASVRDNLRLVAPDASDEDLAAACRTAHIHDLIVSLPDGYATMVGERGYRFSGGERQRLAIARIVLRNPPILVLDEATSALDTRTERAVQEALDELAKGRTTIVIAHRLTTVAHADQIVVLDHGRIVERGTHAGLIAQDGAYARLATA